MLDNRNEVAGLSIWAVIFLACLGVVVVGTLTGLNFGTVGALAWFVVIVSVIVFIIWIISQIR